MTEEQLEVGEHLEAAFAEQDAREANLALVTTSPSQSAPARARDVRGADPPKRVRPVDFQFEPPATARLKIVLIVDATREWVGGVVDRSISGDQIRDEPDRLAAEHRAYPVV